MTINKNVSQVLIFPGETLVDLLFEKGMTQAELADRMGRPLKTINEIIKGKSSITPDTAIQLEGVFSVPASFWLNLESNYQLSLARFNFEENLRAEFKISEKYPYKEMAKLGWIPRNNETKDIVQSLLNFFGVISLKNIIEKNIFAVGAQYRISAKRGYSTEAITSWLRKGVLESQKIETKDFDEKKLKDSLPDIRSLILSSPQDFIPKIAKILADCGVVLVVLKNLKNAPINGVTRWISPKKALIQMSIRGKYADIFWFSLFHEIGHLLLHRKKDIYVDFVEDDYNKEQETQADEFASNILIPKDKFESFLNSFRVYKNVDLLNVFAQKIGVSVGIVVGRLQNDGIISRNQLNSLRAKYKRAS
ncbi:addiction module antidote protein, HigA family [Candidatus Falkowbacteria bacterium CG_4_10_14_0_2_um_filter_41_15]|uniref:Addiction module antidote protein, HigA family n=3 Tax=Candidatus Falkowiibacteriota TaxID=1752728 RepID=A0A2G9ZNV2_9BACT|nr:MAG: addiction module antidote protein, HigA family [Candidatus Falkowbacteria bacterium CG1_02_41_21]PIP34856.1 MAG: addiction module antidote protein, HigA family [Candidatus Falkowbacteria bacterium CG23_combo_of_CG06-09_8_20_14_all_41_10]PJA09551.1 MAG: addiction module antidote protein, HigA family [Candidatus Falkowbacteria bacterium CG_4_10_14_0_2_um_filter_41_15]